MRVTNLFAPLTPMASTHPSLYKVINFRGIKPIYLPSIWSLKIPPRVNFFLWMLSQNKIMTRDNVAKRKHVEDKTCLFCSEDENPHHFFFEYVVAKQVWCNISEAIGRVCGSDFVSIGQLWLSNKKFVVVNMFTSAALWGLWKLRNSLCFQNGRWKDVQSVLHLILALVQSWKLLCPAGNLQELELLSEKLKHLAQQPGTLAA